MRFTLKNPRFLQYIDYQNVRKTEFLGCQSQEKKKIQNFARYQNSEFYFYSGHRESTASYSVRTLDSTYSSLIVEKRL